MITTSAGGCTTPFPFEAAIWLLEEQEELYGGTMPVRSEVCISELAKTLRGINAGLLWNKCTGTINSNISLIVAGKRYIVACIAACDTLDIFFTH